MLFHKQAPEALATLGRITTPSLSDVFMACTQAA
jgi:hypothetical protein